MKGKFITFEGCEGVGKSTQIRLLDEYLTKEGIPHIITREPGGTAVGERVRDILKDEALSFSAETELLLFESARCENVKTVIMPALNEGKLVIADRFIGSTTAYQAFGRGIDRKIVDDANRFGSLGLKIDLTIFLDALPFSNCSRTASDRMELAGEEFHSRVYQGYKQMEKENDSFVGIKTEAEKTATAAKIITLLKEKGIIP